ncbi:holin family protein [uncultured Jannaschia sp.]|uniref:holin family protein n=1 Tax=uncultured Jannaschia sp. TaxID=293347 RepID=UPI002601A752|nr:holin family protein [uncultured Jannaschia sp.]
MGLMGGIAASTGAVATLGRAARGLSEVFVPNASEGQREGHETQRAALEQLGAEFELDRGGWFDRCIDGMNRLPRPMLALGTMGLFVYAMIEPVGFARRMEGLSFVPEPLWWLLGAIVGFYFGARELHYVRRPRAVAQTTAGNQVSSWHVSDRDSNGAEDEVAAPPGAPVPVAAFEAEAANDTANPALAEWRTARG